MMGVINNRHKLFLLLTLMALIMNSHYASSSPIDIVDLTTTSKSEVLQSNLIIKSGEDSVVVIRKKGKRKKKRKGKEEKVIKDEKQVPNGNIVADLASIFADFLSSVTDVPKNDEAIKVLQTIASTVSMY